MIHRVIQLSDVNSGDHVSIEHHETGAEALPTAGDVRIGVAVKVGTFAGEYDQVWVSRDDWRSFVSSLRRLEASRSGEAVLRAMSPDEFECRVRVVDSAGHVAVDGFLARPHWHRYAAAYRTRIEFCIEVDPSRLRELTEQFETFGRSP